MQGADIGLSVLGVCGIVVAAIFKMPFRKGSDDGSRFVCTDVCSVRHEGVEREITAVRTDQARQQKEISESLRGIYAKLEALTEMVLRQAPKE